MKPTLMIQDLPMNKSLDRKAMAAVYGGNGMGSVDPSTSTTSTASSTPTITPLYGHLPPTYLNLGTGPIMVASEQAQRATTDDGGEALKGFIAGLMLPAFID